MGSNPPGRTKNSNTDEIRIAVFFVAYGWARTHRCKSGETHIVKDTIDEQRDSRNAGADYTTFESPPAHALTEFLTAFRKSYW